MATDVETLGQSVRRWGIGRTVPPDNDAALAGAIRELFEPRTYREASQVVDRAKDSLSWTRTAEATIEGYRSVRKARASRT